MDELILRFNALPKNFSQPIKWDDGTGFSVIEKYRDGNASLYKIGFGKAQEDSSSSLKSLWVSVSYGQDIPGGISMRSSQKIQDPIDLVFRDEFFYDTNTLKCYEGKKVISPNDLLSEIENKHKLPTKITISGLRIRSKLWFWRVALPKFIQLCDLIIILILRIISGERTKDDIWKRLLWRKDEDARKSNIDIEFENSKTMEFFGYKAKRWSVVFYCTLHLTIYLVFFCLFQAHYYVASKIGSNSFIILCYVVVSFAITESLIPKILKFLIETTIPSIFRKISFRIIKI